MNQIPDQLTIAWATTSDEGWMCQQVIVARTDECGTTKYIIHAQTATKDGRVSTTTKERGCFDEVINEFTGWRHDPAVVRELQESWRNRLDYWGYSPIWMDSYRAWLQRDFDRWLEKDPTYFRESWQDFDDPDVVGSAQEAVERLRTKVEKWAAGTITEGTPTDDDVDAERVLCVWMVRGNENHERQWVARVVVRTDGSEVYGRTNASLDIV